MQPCHLPVPLCSLEHLVVPPQQQYHPGVEKEYDSPSVTEAFYLAIAYNPICISTDKDQIFSLKSIKASLSF